jgi:hypothetical protein
LASQPIDVTIGSLRGSGESYSDVLLRLAGEMTPTKRTKVK